MAQEKLEEILTKIADAEGLTSYEIHPHTDVLRGDGFLSECYTGEVINKITKTETKAYIKIQPNFLTSITTPAYDNEICFYSKIFPELNKFQNEKNVKNPFQNIPKFYCGDDKKDNKYVAMEDLRVQDYVLFDKSVSMDKKHLKLIFENYGKYHALTFAYKDQNYEKYMDLVKPLSDIFVELKGGMVEVFPAACTALKEISTDLAKKIDPIKENFDNSYTDAATYKGKYSALTHGDCWSNNMLFKYKENRQIEDIKMIDFQLCRDSTPIHDLSYFFYSAASKEEFQHIEEYLELYHKSFSAFARELGSDPEKLLPLSSLKSEWKKYSLAGIFLGIMLWHIKLTKKEKLEEIAKNRDENETAEAHKNVADEIFESDEFKKNTSNILIHAIEYGII